MTYVIIWLCLSVSIVQLCEQEVFHQSIWKSTVPVSAVSSCLSDPPWDCPTQSQKLNPSSPDQVTVMDHLCSNASPCCFCVCLCLCLTQPVGLLRLNSFPSNATLLLQHVNTWWTTIRVSLPNREGLAQSQQVCFGRYRSNESSNRVMELHRHDICGQADLSTSQWVTSFSFNQKPLYTIPFLAHLNSNSRTTHTSEVFIIFTAPRCYSIFRQSVFMKLWSVMVS